MRHASAARVFALVLTAVAVFSTRSVEHTTHLTVFPQTYIVTLDSGFYSKHGDLVHVEFYRDLQSRGVNWTVVREYLDPLFTGTVIQLPGATNLGRLTEMIGAELVRPMNIHHTPKLIESAMSSISKRAHNGGIPWSHTLTGVDKLHAAGHRGQGITIGIIGSGVDYTHPALGGGFGPGHKVVGGYNFVGDVFTGLPNSPPPEPSSDPIDTCNGQGTHVAGIIAADPDPERTIAGVAYQASINAYRISGCNGIEREDITIDALIHAHRDGNDIINLSSYYPWEWGRATVSTVIERIASRGRIVTVAAGDHGQHGAWMTDFIGRHPRVIAAGHAAIFSRDPLNGASTRAIMSFESAYGPTSDMHLGAALSAPGVDIFSTWPMALGRYKTLSGSSMAAAFTAGSMALWLQVHGKTAHSTMAARMLFQGTALPMQFPKKSLVDTVARQGAGLIQVHQAILGDGIMFPAELLLNDTTYPILSWTIYIKNLGQEDVTYALSHLPAGTMITAAATSRLYGPPDFSRRAATVAFSHKRLAIPAGSMRPVQVSLRPPTRLDPLKLPVYSGYIKAAGSDGSTLQSLYLGLAASMKQMRILATKEARLYGQDKPTGRPVVYTMEGIDTPVMVFRLLAGTPLLVLQLVDAGARAALSVKCSGGLRVKCFLGRPKGNCFSWVVLPGTGPVRSICSDHLNVLGTIEERRNAGHSRETWESRGPDKIAVTRFADGSAIPNGRYRLLLRALKNYGDPLDKRDYEAWISPEIIIKRN